MTEGDYYRKRANEALKPSTLPYNSFVTAHYHGKLKKSCHVKIYHGFVNVANAFYHGVCNDTYNIASEVSCEECLARPKFPVFSPTRLFRAGFFWPPR